MSGAKAESSPARPLTAEELERSARVELEKLSANIRQDVAHVLHEAKTRILHPVALRILAYRVEQAADELDKKAADAEHSGVG